MVAKRVLETNQENRAVFIRKWNDGGLDGQARYESAEGGVKEALRLTAILRTA